ncbi:type I-E CRISPR-associated protein Cas7/Cse4/CasC [Micrococcus sp.]|uniref:type I-E CRISPR-associated protein Cas7/Cse4/CasC n=1 Tax=Micrococcus sp. TaxID=1271 RepID=UPI002A908B1F|nr:type I-E CRISPR-associated protein Cas7/Cse4/CasC [Micrococcus sp.]MDY6054510.1 type I-E CRISPR-associated protein Cas7/Cse4/CasC [Micrococcus sp.]
MSIFIDIHALQTLPPNNINRDDTGAPKTATFGGVPRQRVSSQAWKRAIREDFKNYLDPSELGVRTKRVVEKIAYRAVSLQGISNPDLADSQHRELLVKAAEGAEALLSKAGFKPAPKKLGKNATEQEKLDAIFAEVGYLLFLSDQQVTRIAEAVNAKEDTSWSKKEAAELVDTAHSVDVAMFGRMVADEPSYNVDASVQVAHAIGVSASEPEFDYFTAVDDMMSDAEEAGAGMIGTVPFTSSSLYRYANINLDGLIANLGSREMALRAVDAFVKAFITSMPTGKQNTFANNTMPEVVVVAVREDRPVSWVNAFEEPVAQDADGGRRQAAARKLAAEANGLADMYDAPARRTWVVAMPALVEALSSVGSNVSRAQLLEELGAELAEVLA